jgi:hypothetical protein
VSLSIPHGTRGELRNVLLDQLRIVQSLLDSIEDPRVATAQLARLAMSLERLDDRRNALLRALREEATEARKREEERSLRQFVLRALDEMQVPQNAGFLREYVWAREAVDLNTRGFGSLRRDERRSWHRHPGRRLAYIVPALDADGRALARWMARSDWPLARRTVVADRSERMLDLYKLRVLFNAHEEAEQRELGDPFIPAIEKYARDVLDVNPPAYDHAVSRKCWFADLRQEMEAELADLGDTVAEIQQAAAARLATLPEEQQLWGFQDPSRRPG